jgi:hypothetical protein
MKRIAFLVALAIGSQGCVNQAKRGRSSSWTLDDTIVAATLVVLVAGAGAAALMYQANKDHPDPHIPQYPPPPEQQPQPMF